MLTVYIMFRVDYMEMYWSECNRLFFFVAKYIIKALHTVKSPLVPRGAIVNYQRNVCNAYNSESGSDLKTTPMQGYCGYRGTF